MKMTMILWVHFVHAFCVEYHFFLRVSHFLELLLYRIYILLSPPRKTNPRDPNAALQILQDPNGETMLVARPLKPRRLSLATTASGDDGWATPNANGSWDFGGFKGRCETCIHLLII